jgi:hypothetical protein
MITWFLILISVTLAIVHSPWWLIAVVPLAIWKANRLYWRYSRPWRRVHYPMMIAFARAAGTETAIAEQEGRDYDVRRVVLLMIKEIHSDWTEQKIAQFVDKEISALRARDDLVLLRRYLTEKQKRAPDEVNGIVELAERIVDVNDNGLIVRAVIAGIIQERYSVSDKAEYFFEIFRGRAT